MIVIDENWSIGADKNQWVVYKTDKVGCKPTYFYPRLEQALKRVVMNDVRSAARVSRLPCATAASKSSAVVTLASGLMPRPISMFPLFALKNDIVLSPVEGLINPVVAINLAVHLCINLRTNYCTSSKAIQ